MAKIQLNGKKIVIKSKYSLFDLLKKYKLDNKKVAVEHNGIIIPKVNYKKKNLKGSIRVSIGTIEQMKRFWSAFKIVDEV